MAVVLAAEPAALGTRPWIVGTREADATGSTLESARVGAASVSTMRPRRRSIGRDSWRR